MPLMRLSKLLNEARLGGYAVGYFESWDTYSFEAVVEAAEQERSPVVLGFGGTMMDPSWLERFGIKSLGAYGRTIAEKAKVPVAFILNEVVKLTHIVTGIHSGFNTVMLDSCHLSFAESVEISSKVVELARPHGIEVQAEIGRLPNFGEEDPGMLTDPTKARLFVDQTGIDCLAISIGNVHLQTEGSSTVDIERLKAIRKNVDVPLVIHGGTGFPHNQIREVIRNGVTLFHFGTAMKKAFFESTQSAFKSVKDKNKKIDYQAMVGSRKSSDILMPAKQKIKKIISYYMQLYGSAGRAAGDSVK